MEKKIIIRTTNRPQGHPIHVGFLIVLVKPFYAVNYAGTVISVASDHEYRWATISYRYDFLLLI